MMIWPFQPTKRVRMQQAAAAAKLAAAEEQLRVVERRWPTVESLREALVTRRLENGFGEELAVSFTPRGRHS